MENIIMEKEMEKQKNIMKMVNQNLKEHISYFIGERNGKGKVYNRNGELEFEGEYLNGERNGKGKE